MDIDPPMRPLLIFMLLWLSIAMVNAGLLDALFGRSSTNQSAVVPNYSLLSQDQMVQGLKEALGQGVQQAVSRLGQNDGFLTNLNVRIPMPQQLQKVERTLRAVGQDKMADDFVATMNHAAEKAVPEAAGVFVQAVERMSFQDARSILMGTNNAATEYFRRTTDTNLFQRFLPIVKNATDQTGVTAAYKQLMERAGGSGSLGALGRSLLGAESVDLDSYVTNKALDGLFKMVGEEEKRIRENPAARTTALLQKVFGALGK